MKSKRIVMNTLDDNHLFTFVEVASEGFTLYVQLSDQDVDSFIVGGKLLCNREVESAVIITIITIIRHCMWYCSRDSLQSKLVLLSQDMLRPACYLHGCGTRFALDIYIINDLTDTHFFFISLRFSS
eukprot:Lithocolla_globosa_v1_NODE_115_length_6172_cov_14.462155.p9 type:complete len:127 gc:universal NODE_115_length_6172_cov_14.462155:1537-1917(+)